MQAQHSRNPLVIRSRLLATVAGSRIYPQGGTECPSPKVYAMSIQLTLLTVANPLYPSHPTSVKKPSFPLSFRTPLPAIPSASPRHSERLPLSFRAPPPVIPNAAQRSEESKIPATNTPNMASISAPHPFAATIERPRISSRSYRHFQVSLRHSMPARHHPRAHPAKPPFPFVASPSNRPFRSW